MDANGEVAVILDVLHSAFTDAVCLFVRFPRNVGNARPYDILELSPGRTYGVEKWQPATPEQLEARLAARQAWVEGEIEQLRQSVTVLRIEEEASVLELSDSMKNHSP